VLVDKCAHLACTTWSLMQAHVYRYGLVKNLLHSLGITVVYALWADFIRNHTACPCLQG
jgi:hypothetical protein